MSSTHIDAIEADNGGREMAIEVERDGDRVSIAVLEYDGEVTRVACVHLTTDDAFIVGDTVNACATEVRSRAAQIAIVGELDQVAAERDAALAEATRLADLADVQHRSRAEVSTDKMWRAKATRRHRGIWYHWAVDAESPHGRWTASGWTLTRSRANANLTAALTRLADLAIASNGTTP